MVEERKLKAKLQTKLVIAFSVLFILSVSIMGFLSYQHTHQALEEQVFHHIEHISKDLADRIDSFFYERLITIKTTATSIYLKSRLKQINSSTNNYEQLRQEMCRRLEQLKKDDPHISELFILDTKGKVIASTDKEQIGKDKSDRDYFKEKLTTVTDIYISPTLNAPTMVVSCPLIDEGMDKESRAFLGMIAARINIEDFEKVIEKSIGWYKEEEAYIINKEGFFLAGHISKDIPALGVKLHSKGIEDCLTNRVAEIDIYPNYKGVLVVGGYQYLKDRQWALLVELGLRQAFRPIYNLRIWFLGIGIIVTLLVIGFIMWFAKQITSPLLKLTTASHEIAAGNLDISVKVKTGDEIELLADSFNQMVEDLKKSKRKLEEWGQTLEQKVKEKTKELNGKIEELEEFNKLSVGRELKMLEMKKRIEELEFKLKEKI